MTHMEKNLMRAGVAGVTLAVLVAVAAEHSAKRQSLTTATVPPPVPATAQPQAVPAVPAPAPPDAQPVAATVGTSAITVSPIAPLPANATSVPDEDLLKLAGMVDLAGARDHQPDKKRWERALAVAEQLAQGPCDCEQRNWLNHFVEMGGYALSGASQDYYQSAQLMATLGRNDNDAMNISRRPN